MCLRLCWISVSSVSLPYNIVDIHTFLDSFPFKSIHGEIARDFTVRILGRKEIRAAFKKGKLHLLKT